MVHLALQAAEKLAAEDISVRVVNIHTVKPLDTEIITRAARETGAIVTAEEHNIIGGLGSAVAEAVAEACPVPVLRVGVEDTFGRSGKVPPLLEMYGLTVENLVAKAKAAIALKK
jgi:transketolase